ncbi:diguanylate cyclase [Pseudomonas cavernicola]|uniref:diguanylate cyclase n=1 Tax=Pseudomonas cavernicola TaxID=2320866 RepID=A0A418XPF5_9PSED|nr:diguanylate cyclase [Pseudomonas cavernicola]RJG14359.1 diguanylate cyclase [Pseudomonas cavernicola]
MPFSRSAWPARLALALLALLLCGASLLLWHQLKSTEREHVRERVESQARLLTRQLESSLNAQAQDLYRMAQLWNHHGRLSREEWELEARISLQHFRGYQAIQWLGPDLKMRWLLPLEGNQAALHFQLTPAHPNFNLAMQAKARGLASFSNSFSLVQGGRGFILYTPLYIRGEQDRPVFDGFLQGVFRVEALMDELLDTVDSADFHVRLLEFGHPLYSRDQADLSAPLQQELPLHLLNNRNFTLQLSPTQKLTQQLVSPLPQVVLGASLTISLLLVAALALALENSRRARALQAGNRRLNEEVGHREQIEQVLRDSRERLQLVVDLTDSSRDGLFIIDPQNRNILHMNQATYSSLGYSSEEFSRQLKEQPEQLLLGFHAWLELVRQAHRDNSTKIFQREMRRRDGSIQAAEISAQLVQLNGHEYLIGVSRDNNERLQLEAQLQHLSQQDGLTGLYNRRFFDHQLHGEWRRLQRIGASMALLMLDVDHFKRYNDQLGHLAGDDVLRRVATALQGCLQREGDVACRYGGEEFAIILVNTGLDGGEHVAQRVHKAIEELNLAHPASPLGRLSLSIGLATTTPSQNNQPDSLVAHSDQALYQAKHQGRNRTCIWNPAN